MINLLLGQPGGGKSYEAVAFHIIQAIEQGRKVITNLSVKPDVFAKFFPGSDRLLELRNPVLGENGVVRPFSKPEHYGDPWRHPESGAGPLYVVDECHLALPRIGTSREVEEWYSLHRHEGADVLLITQSYGKISHAIRDLVQVVYRCKKATAFGSNDRYIRKVQDGIRGDVVNTSIRVYEPKYFQFYKSHTRSGGAVNELAANDIVPYWKRWPFKGAAICLVIVVGMSIYNTNRGPKKVPPKAAPAVEVKSEQVVAATQLQPVKVAAEPLIEALPRGPDKKLHPYDGYTFHLSAVVYAKRFDAQGNPYDYLDGLVSIANGGNSLKTISLSDLRTAGYEITYMSPSVLAMTYKGYDLGYVVSDSPRVTLQPVDGITKTGH